MTNNRYLFFLKKHIHIVIIIIILPIVILLSFIYIPCLKENINNSHWLTYFGAILVYYGTMHLSSVAIFQAEEANLLSENVYKLNKKTFYPVVAITNVLEKESGDCSIAKEFGSIVKEQLTFCQVDASPQKCTGYLLEIRNYSQFPIDKISVKHIYRVGKKCSEETLVKDISVIVTPQSEYNLLLCDTPCFAKNGSYVTFQLTFRNIYGYSISMEIEIGAKYNENEDNVQFMCRLLDNDY